MSSAGFSSCLAPAGKGLSKIESAMQQLRSDPLKMTVVIERVSFPYLRYTWSLARTPNSMYDASQWLFQEERVACWNGKTSITSENMKLNEYLPFYINGSK